MKVCVCPSETGAADPSVWGRHQPAAEEHQRAAIHTFTKHCWGKNTRHEKKKCYICVYSSPVKGRCDYPASRAHVDTLVCKCESEAAEELEIDTIGVSAEGQLVFLL